MAVVSTAVTVGTTATVVAAVDATRRRVSVKNIGATTVYLGGSGVTTTNGYPLRQYEVYEITQSHPADTATKQPIYGIVATGTQAVNVLSVNN